MAWRSVDFHIALHCLEPVCIQLYERVACVRVRSNRQHFVSWFATIIATSRSEFPVACPTSWSLLVYDSLSMQLASLSVKPMTRTWSAFDGPAYSLPLSASASVSRGLENVYYVVRFAQRVAPLQSHCGMEQTASRKSKLACAPSPVVLLAVG